MKAIAYDRYGSPDVLELRDVPTPTCNDDHVLVRIRAAAANPFDWHLLRGDPYLVHLAMGLRKPRRAMILGSDVAGVVEAVGVDVTRFRPGDEVYAVTEVGGFAEYVSIREPRVALKPATLTFEQAAAVPVAALTALQSLGNGERVKKGQKVLINGASGGIGTFAVQIAKSFGAEVTGVCSTAKVDMVRSIGADHVIDYTRQDFAQSGRRYDLLLDTVGNRSLSDFRRALTRTGTFVIVGGGGGRWLGPMSQRVKAALASPFVSQRIVLVSCNPIGKDLEILHGLIETGKVTPVIDRTYPLGEVPDAIRHLEEGHNRGKIVITIGDSTKVDIR